MVFSLNQTLNTKRFTEFIDCNLSQRLVEITFNDVEARVPRIV